MQGSRSINYWGGTGGGRPRPNPCKIHISFAGGWIETAVSCYPAHRFSNRCRIRLGYLRELFTKQVKVGAMGSMIHLSVGRLEIDWGKNRGFSDHSGLFQTTDVTSVPYYYVKDGS